MYGVEVAMVQEADLMKLETAVLRAVWGTSQQSRAKEVLFAVLLKGHRASPVMRAKYLRTAFWPFRIVTWKEPHHTY